ncbi:EAL domain-containing protein [Pseudoalteromonas sp. BZB3]|uniref:sensor domain-containing protein n=1 Tax=Pseudoalteromonas sp. BZB3 TaxID=3136670 RepID=UPI0032C3EA88
MLIWEEWMHRNNMVLTVLIVFIVYFSSALLGETFALADPTSPSLIILADVVCLLIAHRFWQGLNRFIFPALATLLSVSMWLFSLPQSLIVNVAFHLLIVGQVYFLAGKIRHYKIKSVGLKRLALAYLIGVVSFVSVALALSKGSAYFIGMESEVEHLLQAFSILLFASHILSHDEEQEGQVFSRSWLLACVVCLATMPIALFSLSSFFLVNLLLFIASRLLLNGKQFASLNVVLAMLFSSMIVLSEHAQQISPLGINGSVELLLAVCTSFFLLTVLLEHARFQHSFEYSQVMLVTIDEQGQIVHASKGFLDAMQCDFEDLQGRYLSEYLSEENASDLLKCGVQGQSHFYLPEVKLTTFSQRKLSLSLFADVVDDKDTHTQTIISFQDISDKLMLTQALSEEKELLEVTLSSIGDGVICTDKASRITYMNPVAEAVLAKLTKEVKGKQFSEVMPLFHEDTLEPIERVTDDCMRQRATLGLPELTCIKNHLGLVFAIQDSISPIYSKSGEIIGSVMVFQDVTESRMMTRKMNHLAHHDALTGLPNRLLLQDRLAQACKRADRNQHAFAVVFIDLDKFKNINDSLGHDAGDLLLQEVAHRLNRGLRSCDTVARMGGDEFVILVDSIKERAHIHTVIEKVLLTCSGEYELKGIQLNVTLSAGIAVYPDDGTNSEMLMKHADTAMYRAKKVNKSNYQFYNSQLDKEVEQRIEREAELVQGLKHGQFEPYFQAIVNAKSFALEKLEMLARWQTQEKLKGPHEFIAVAEEAGLMNKVTLQLLEKSMTSLVRWITTSVNLQLSVNLTADQLLDESFLNEFESLLDRYQISPKNIELEITETSLIANLDEMRQSLEVLQEKGFSVAIDDFGTGYSSLTYLKHLKFNTLKIDKKFVDDLNYDREEDDLAVVIINMAKSLGVSTVAEGVEYCGQAKRLADAGCSQLQGYCFAKPMPIDAISNMVELGTVMSQIHRKMT